MVIRALLDLYQVRHGRDLGDAAEAFADALFARKGYSHTHSSLKSAPILVARSTRSGKAISRRRVTPMSGSHASPCSFALTRQNPACAATRAPGSEASGATAKINRPSAPT